MEVASFFTDRKTSIDLLETYFMNHSGLECLKRDDDTSYYSDRQSGKNEFYYHFELEDVENEFSYNYSTQEVDYIRKYFGGNKFYLIDISYRSSQFLFEILKEYSINSLGESKTKELVHIDGKFIDLLQIS